MKAPAGGTDNVLMNLGVYVLGALQPDESAAVAGHLAGCEPCRLEADRLAVVRSWLDQLTPDDVMEFAADQPDGAAIPADDTADPSSEGRAGTALDG